MIIIEMSYFLLNTYYASDNLSLLVLLQPPYEMVFANAKTWLYLPTKPSTTMALKKTLGILKKLDG